MRTPRGLLATLGATLSMVAAAACVLLFTSTLVAVKGWPGLSAPPNGGPVALAPVERQVVRGQSDTGSRSTPVVLGAPATASASPAPVGLGPSAAAGDSQSTVAGQHIESGAAPRTTTPNETQQDTTNPGAVVPIALAPTGTGPSIVPAVEIPASTPVTTTPQSEQDQADTGYAPSERSVTVNAISENDGEWPSDDLEPQSEALAPQTYTRTPATSWPEEEEAEAPVEDEPAPTVLSAPEADRESEHPTRQSARTSRPDVIAEEPQTSTAPAPEKPEEPETQPKPDAGTHVEPQPEPCPPAAEPQPEPTPEPQPCPPEQTTEPQPEPAPQPESPAPEQAPATQPCP